MESKSLLFGIIGFIAGGLIVSIAASTAQPAPHDHTEQSDTSSMTSMTESLAGKTGDEFDKEFITQMIAHHQGALDMAKLSADQASRTEIKTLSNTIIATQTNEINTLKSWQKQWGHTTNDSGPEAHSH